MFERKFEDEGSFFASNREKSRQWRMESKNQPIHFSTEPQERTDAVMR
jgi:hypothetical protein